MLNTYFTLGGPGKGPFSGVPWCVGGPNPMTPSEIVNLISGIGRILQYSYHIFPVGQNSGKYAV